MSALDTWKALNQFDLTLPSGTNVKGRYVDMETAVLGGGFDFSVLKGLRDAAAADPNAVATPEQEAEAIAAAARYKRYVFVTCLLEVEGEKVELTDADFDDLPEADRDAFFAKAKDKPVPFAEAS